MNTTTRNRHTPFATHVRQLRRHLERIRLRMFYKIRRLRREARGAVTAEYAAMGLVGNRSIRGSGAWLGIQSAAVT